MSRTEKRVEVDEWEVEICKTCGHEEGQHYKETRRVVVSPSEYYIASGCMVLRPPNDPQGRVLPGEPKPNPFPRCPCTEFK